VIKLEIISSRHFIYNKLKTNTFQEPFPKELQCEKCNHRMLPVFSLVDDEGIFVDHKPLRLENDEFWFHDSVALVVYLCVNPKCGVMRTLWNQA